MAPLTVSNYLAMLQDNPDDAEAYAGLREALASGDPKLLGDEPVRLVELARVGHERRGETRASAWLIELQTLLVHDDPDLEAALWKELGRLQHEELLDDAGSKAAYEKALELRPGDDDIQAAIDKIELAASKWRQIADRMVQEADSASDPTLQTSLLTTAGALVWQHKVEGRDDEADALFSKAIETDPSDARAARLFLHTLRVREHWERMAETLERVGQHVKSRDDKQNLNVEAGRILSKRLKDVDRAAIAYRQVLELSPGHEEAMKFLVDYFTEREHWDDLVALYEDALRSRQKLEDEQGILMQLGMIHWRIRGVPADAEPFFARLRKIDPAHPGMLSFYREYKPEDGDDQQKLLSILADAQRVAKDKDQKLELAVELARQAQSDDATIERAIDAWKAVQRIDAEHEEAKASLKDLYQRAEKWNALVEVLRNEVDALPDSAAEERLALLRELVPIYRDRLQLDVMVVNTYSAILKDAPGDLEALERLGETYESMGRWNDLIQILMKRADAAEDADGKVGFLMRVANLWIERFANYNQATKPLEAVIAVQEDNREALSMLKDIYTKKRAWKSLFSVLRKESELASDPDARLEMKIELAKLAGERLNKHAEAIELWREVIDVAPDTEGALDALERLAERQKDWPTLCHVLELRVERVEDDKSRIKILQKLGSVYAEHVDDPMKSASAWKRILEVDPKNGRALRTLRETFLKSGDFEGLERLYAEANDWEGLVEVLGSAAERTEDDAVKVQLSFRAAEIYEEQIGEPQRAFRNYERVLSVEPSNERAAKALLPLYEKDEKWSRVVGLLGVLYEATPAEAEPERLELLEKLRTLCLQRLSDGKSAFGWAAKAYGVAPSDAAVRKGLEETADAAGAHADLADLYLARIDATSDDDEQMLLRRRVASLAGEKLGKSDEAIAQLKQILEADPTDEESVEVLDRLYRSAGQSEELRALYAHRLEHTAQDAAARHKLLLQVAELEEEVLGDTEGATARYRAILDIDPDDAVALAALDRLATAGERWREVTEILRRRVDIVREDDERVDLTNRLGDLLREMLAEPDAALDAYADVLVLAPENSNAIHGIEDIEGEHKALADRAGRLLEGAYLATGQVEKLTGVLRRRMKATKDREEKRELRLRVAELTSELGDSSAAYVALEAAFLDRPSDSELWGRLQNAAERAGKHEELAQAFATAIEAGELGDDDAAQLSSRIADIYDVVLGRPQDAEPHHRRVIAHDPLHGGSFAALKELYTTAERWDELQSLYRERIEATLDGDAKLELLLQVCFLHEEIIGDSDKAISAYQEVLELQPDHAPSRRALERLYRKAERWPDLVSLLRQELYKSEGQEAIDITFELGELHEQRLGEPGPAVDQYEAVLEKSPTHMRAQEALERLLSAPEQRQRVAAILEPLYEAQGGWAELARVLEVQLEDAGSPGAQVGLLMRIAEIQEQREHDPDKAFAALARAVTTDPADGRAREELARLATVRGSQRERAAVLEKAIEAAPEAYLQSELLLEVARLWDDYEQDFEAAGRAYQRLIEVDGDNPDVVLPASRALERIHLANDDHAALAQDLRRQVRFEEDQSERGALLVRLATLLEEVLEDVPGAIAAHRERLEINPADEDALIALETLYERQQSWQELIGVLQARETATDDEGQQRSFARRIGAIYEEKLEDRDNAIASYNDVISRFGNDRETLAALARLYEATEKWTDLLDVYEMDFDLAEASYERAELRFKSAELMRTKTGELERALECYGEVLGQLPGHEGTIEALEEIVTGDYEKHVRTAAADVLVPHYEGSADYQALIVALEVVAETDEPFERLRALRRAAEVADIGLEDPKQAFELMGRAVKAGLAEDDLRDMLSEYERFAAASDGWKTYVSVLVECVPDILDGELQTEVLLQIATISRSRLEDDARAREFFQKVLHNQPEHRGALDALEELHGEAGDHQALLEVVRRKAELATTADARVPLLLRQAEICEEKLEDVRAAIDAYEMVLGEAEEEAAFEGLERLYQKAEQWDDLSQLYERALDATVGDSVATRYKLGRVFLDHLEDPHQALEHFRLTLSKDGSHEETITALEELMKLEEHRAVAAEILEPVFLGRMDWPKVTGALEARLSDETDLAVRKELLRRLGEIHEDYLEDLDGALEQYARLFREDPADRDVWETLGRLGRVLEKWDRLAEIYAEALADITVDDPDTARLAFITGELFETKASDLDKAEVHYERALRFDPTDEEGFLALERVRIALERWGSLLALYRERVDVVEIDSERIALLHKIASLQEKKLDTPGAAVDVYREILEINPADAEATEALDRLLTGGENWAELADHLRSRIEAAIGSGEELELKHRLAEILAERLHDKDGAIDVFEEIVQQDPGFAPTVAALEEMVLDELHQLRITQILEPIYRGQDEWKKLIAILEAQVSLSDYPSDKVRLLGEIGRLHEERGDEGGLAFAAWARAFAASPDDETARAELDRLADALDAWAQHVQAYEQALGNADDPATKSELLNTIARVHDEKRGDPRAAIETYERLLAHDPDDASPLDALEALHTMVGDWRGLVDVFTRKTERSLDPAERGELLQRAGSVLEELLADVPAAIDAYRRATEEDAEDLVALEALDRLYLGSKQWRELADVLRRRIEIEDDAELRVELGVRLGDLAQAELDRPEEAISALSKVLEDHPSHPGAVASLGRLYERQEMWSDLLDNLRLQAGMAEEEEQRVALVHRAGQVLEDHLDDTLEAILQYQQALELEPSHEPSLASLMKITEQEDYLSSAAEILEPLLTEQERWDDLAQLLERKIRTLGDPAERRAELRRLGDVHEAGRQDPEAAFDAVSRALNEDPGDAETADELSRLAGVLGAWDRLANTLAARASSVLDPRVGRSLYERLARVCAERLEDDARAIEAYSRAVEQVGDDDSLLAALDALYVKTESWPDLGEVLERRISIAEDPTVQGELLVRLGKVREEHYHDLRGAFGAYRDVLERDPGDPVALEALERLAQDADLAQEVVEVLDAAYKDTGATEKAAALYDHRIELADTPGEKVRLLQEAAGVWEDQLGEPAKALEALARAFALDPTDEALLGELERLAGAGDAWESLRGVVEAVCRDESLAGMMRRDLHLRAAGWYRDHLGDVEAAEGRLRDAVAADRDAGEAHAQLVELLREPGREKDLVPALRAWAAVEMDVEAKRDRLHEAAALAESGLGELETAAECYQAILDADDTDTTALSELARIREEQERWSDVARLVGRHVEVSDDPAVRVELRHRMAALFRDRLEDDDRAIEVLRAVLDEEPGDLAAIEGLEGLYEGKKAWDDLRELIERRLDLAEDDDQRIVARVRLARLEEQAFGRRTEAIQQLREILDIDAQNREALDELERLLGADEQWHELVSLLERRAEIAEADEDEGELLAALGRLATVHEEKLDSPEAARDVHVRVLEYDGNNLGSLRSLVRLYESGEQWVETVTSLELLLLAQEGQEALATAHRIASIVDEHLDEPERAEEALRRVYELDETDTTHDLLKAHYERYGNHEMLAQMLVAELEETDDQETKVELLKHVATMYTERLDDPGTGATYLEQAVEIVPEDRSVLLPLCDLYIKAGRQADAIPVLEKIVQSYGNRRVKELATYHHMLGQAKEGMGDTEGALAEYDAAFKIDLTNVQILRDLGKLCHSQGDMARAQKTFRALLLQKLTDDAGITKADVYFYLGDISAQGGDKAKAISMLERAVAESSDHEAAASLLAELKG